MMQTPKADNKAHGANMKDLTASLGVFLVTLPLCTGIAIESGLHSATGLATGIVGGVSCGSALWFSFAARRSRNKIGGRRV